MAADTHIAWRPSRWLVAAQVAWGWLGAIGVLACDLAGDIARPLAGVAVLAGLLLAARERRRRPRVLPIAELDLRWRGPLAVDAATGLSWWPDTLDAPGRRALRLTASRGK